MPFDRKAYLKNYNQNPINRNRINQQTRNNKKEKKKRLDELKAERGCYMCDEKDHRCLDFHHRDPEQKTAHISDLINRTISWEAIMAEVLKCDVMCSNCHRKLHYRI